LEQVLGALVKSIEHDSDMHIDVNNLQSMAHSMHLIQEELRGVWDGCVHHMVSYQVHMVELELIRRLRVDRCIPPPSRQGDDQDVELCGYLRRDDTTRFQFAQAVGKRLISLRNVTNQRATPVEHRRAARWAEQDYVRLARLLQAHSWPPAGELRRKGNDYTGDSTKGGDAKNTLNHMVKWKLLNRCRRIMGLNREAGAKYDEKVAEWHVQNPTVQKSDIAKDLYHYADFIGTAFHILTGFHAPMVKPR
jgi:hypothetical protein